MDTNVIYTIVGIVITVIIAAYFAIASHTVGRTQAFAQIVQLTDVIRYAVKEADTFYNMPDAEKYNYVAAIAAGWLKDRGVSVPADVLRQLIEGAVELVHKAKSDGTIYSGDKQ
jgi:hypothetical protein